MFVNASKGYVASPLSSSDSSQSSSESQNHGRRRRRYHNRKSLRHPKRLPLSMDNVESALSPIFAKYGPQESAGKKTHSSPKKPPLGKGEYSKRSRSKRTTDDYHGGLHSKALRSTISRAVMEDIESSVREIVSSAYNEQENTLSSLLDGLEAEKREEIKKLKIQHEKELSTLLNYLEEKLSSVGILNAQKQSLLESRLEAAQFTSIKASEELKKVKDDSSKQLYGMENELKSVKQKAMHEMNRLKEELLISAEKISAFEEELEQTAYRLSASHQKTSSLEEKTEEMKRDHNRELEKMRLELQNSKELNDKTVALLKREMNREHSREVDKLRLQLEESTSSKDQEIKALKRTARETDQTKDEIIKLKDQEIHSLRSAMNKIKLSECKRGETPNIGDCYEKVTRPVKRQTEGVKLNNHWEEASGLTRQSDFDILTHSSHMQHINLGSKPPKRIIKIPKTIVEQHRDDLEGEDILLSVSSDEEDRISPIRFETKRREERRDRLALSLRRKYLGK